LSKGGISYRPTVSRKGGGSYRGDESLGNQQRGPSVVARLMHRIIRS